MKFELREKIKVTDEELSEIQSVSRDRLSETLFEKPKRNERASYSPETNQVTEEVN